MSEGVYERWLLEPTAQSAELGEGDQTSTSKLAVPAAIHSWSPPRVVCTTKDPGDLLEPLPATQGSPDAWISEIQDYLKDNILTKDHVSAECIVRLAKHYAVVEGDLYRRDANGILMRCIFQEEGCELLAEIHGGECGSHSSSRTLVGKAFRHGFYQLSRILECCRLVEAMPKGFTNKRAR